MRILFTKGNSVLSKAIRGLTQEPVSHVAVEFLWGRMVVHSNLLGVHFEWAPAFRENCQVVYELERVKPELLQELKNNSRIDNLFKKKIGHTMYDFGALLFAGACFLLRYWFKIPLPKKNLWQSSSMDLCTEWVEDVVDCERDSMRTLYKLYLKLKQSGVWRDANEQAETSEE